jgi:zinc transporter
VQSSVNPASTIDAETDMIPGLVWAFRIHADGSSDQLNIERPIDIRSPGLLWLHFNLADLRAFQWLSANDLNLPPVAKQLVLSKDEFQQLHTVDDCIYGVISDLVRAIDAPTEQIGYLRFAMTENILISGRHQALCSVDATRRILEGGVKISTAAALLETIIGHVADSMERISDKLDSDLDEIEEKILSDSIDDRRKELGRVRRTCVRLHRQLSGLRLVFHRLDKQDIEQLKPAVRLQAAKLAQRLDELDHQIMEMRDRSRLLQEELQLKMEEQSNKSLHLLSVLTSLLLPPTLITGIFGMNTKGLPLTDDENGFYIAMGLLLISAGFAYYIMKRLKIVR